MLNVHDVLQRAAQVAFGTANATATAKLQNVSSFNLTPELQTRAIQQLRGSLAPTHATALDHYKSNATFEVSDESAEDINYWFESLFSPDATPTGAGPYVRDYAAPLTAEAAPTFMTLQYGQTGAVYQMQDASLTTLTMSGSNNSGVQVGGSLVGGKVIAGSLAALSDRTTPVQTRLTGCMAGLKIDAWAGTMGSTAVASSAFAWELTINSNRQLKSFLGACTPDSWNDQPWTGQLKLSLEFNTTTDDYLNAILASANTILERQIEILYTTGADTTLRTLKIQFAGHTMQAPQIFTDRNGVKSFDLVFDGVYNPTFANWLKIQTTSAIDSLV